MYASLQDLIDRYGEDEFLDVADRDRDGAIDAAVIDAALTDAGELIDGYLANLYAVPIPHPVPGLVKGWACVIARALLHPIAPAPEVLTAYKDALGHLRDVQAGRLTLQAAGVAPTPAVVSGTGGGPARIDAPERAFTVAGLRGF